MSKDSFFDEQKEQSLVKARIVDKYFWAWVKVIIPTAKKAGSKITYIDIFSGLCIYDYGAKSIPIKVLEIAITDLDMRNMLKTLFNDANPEYTNSLQEAINKIPSIDNLKYKLEVINHEVGENFVKAFNQVNFVPTLFFVDPCGYKRPVRKINLVSKKC